MHHPLLPTVVGSTYIEIWWLNLVRTYYWTDLIQQGYVGSNHMPDAAPTNCTYTIDRSRTAPARAAESNAWSTIDGPKVIATGSTTSYIAAYYILRTCMRPLVRFVTSDYQRDPRAMLSLWANHGVSWVMRHVSWLGVQVWSSEAVVDGEVK